ncbi:hypothetical protein CAter282_1967 [Collimonas arenae]|uniref:DUF1853 family protein n=1 Tax=Collimonas arenae TaxID=279058 RepID=A0A127QI44_9BURK|nr:DUF1853 family protein [Collimonas arenae]AMO99831.1 hypothetical protein CAter10_2126 [Collimonas arenae]AMP09730.1 hypothetical protein CAter282_1967 [Collimonas arenae]
MRRPVTEVASGCQEIFHRRWNHLADPHVRALAWLLDAPDLLDAAAPQWQGKIATYIDPDLAVWLAEYDQNPQKLQALHSYIGRLPSTRLGLYAEKLLAFYFEQRQLLVAHSVQVRASKNDTVGEFDFLLRLDGGVAHWEFATKFYLLESSGGALQADDFLGPNLADSLGAKMQKILQQQLALSLHPASQAHLAEPVTAAKALVKGWLFYPEDESRQSAVPGVSAHACRGYWCSMSTLQLDESALYQLLPRQRWLAPAKIAVDQALSPAAAQLALSQHFAVDGSPLLLATLRAEGEHALENRRGFVVPDDWAGRAAQQRHLNAAAAGPG